MADLIDRQKIKARFEPWLKVKGYSEGELNMLKAVLYEITVMPSVDTDLSGFSDRLWKSAYERGKAEAVRWIPVSEQLPEDNQEVLFSTKTGWVHLGRYYNDNSVNQWYSSLEKMRAWNNVVNAWIPLPEPYKDGEQDG